MSGEAIHQAMLNLGVDVVAIDADDNLLQIDCPCYNLDSGVYRPPWPRR